MKTFLLWLVRFGILAGVWVAVTSAAAGLFSQERDVRYLLLFLIVVMVASPPYSVNTLGEKNK